MGQHPDSYRKSITDAPNLRDTMAQMCSGCAFYKLIEGTGDGVCEKYEFQPAPFYVCDSYEAQPVPEVTTPAPVDEASPTAAFEEQSYTMALKSNALKAIAKTDDELRVGNYIILNGGRDVSAFEYVGSKRPTRKNKDGSSGEWFTKSTDLNSPHTAVGRFPIGWEHGFEDAQEVPAYEALGYVDWNTKRIDNKGVFVERVLNRRNAYVKWIEELLDAGLIGTSSEADPRLIKVKATGEIEQWGLMGDTLTVQPAEPRNLTQNQLQAYKALKSLTTSNPEAEPEASVLTGAAQATVTASDASTQVSTQSAANSAKEKQDMEAEMQTILDAVNETTSNVKSFTTRLDVIEKALRQEPPTNTSGGKAIAQITDAPEDRPFKSIAAQLFAVKDYTLTKNDSNYPRLKGLKHLEMENLKATGASEAIPGDGGFLLEPTLSSEILAPMHEVSQFTAGATKLPVGTNSNSGSIPGVDETSRVDGSRWGGIRAYWLAEGATKVASRPTFREINWKLKKIAVLSVATDELLMDAAQYSQILRQGAGEELAFKVNDAVFEGFGLSNPLGVMNSPALITVTRETGSKILGEDISRLWNRMDPRGRKNAVWYVGNDSLPQLDNLFAVGSTAVLYPYASIVNGIQSLYGRPVVVTEYNSALNTTGDILLADMSQYYMWDKGGTQEDSSIHVYFTTDETAFRFVYRVEGLPAVASAITPFHGSTTTSPFVVLGSAT